MAQPTTAAWTLLLIQLGNGASPEVFTPPCVLTTKGINIAATTASVAVPDCDDPNLPAWVHRAIRDLSGTINGSGVLGLEAFGIWRPWALAPTPKNCRVKIDVSLANNGGYFAGLFLITRFEIGATRNDPLINLSGVTLESTGAITWVPASA